MNQQIFLLPCLIGLLAGCGGGGAGGASETVSPASAVAASAAAGGTAYPMAGASLQSAPLGVPAVASTPNPPPSQPDPFPSEGASN